MFNSKCAYCESKVGAASSPVLEHFRPKTYYPWLGYSWENLYLSCSICSRYKAAKFPVDGTMLEATKIVPIDDVDAQKLEKYLILDPCNSRDIFENRFEYNDNGEIIATTERGQITIDICMLNRIELVRSRREHISIIKNMLELFNLSFDISIISKYVNDNTEYFSLYCYYIFNYYMSYRNELSDSLVRDLLNIISIDIRYRDIDISKIKKEHSKKYQENTDYIYGKNSKKVFKTKIIKKVEISNFKSIKQVTLLLSGNNNNINESCLVLVGENGKGKSSILQAISMALISRENLEKQGLNLQHFIRKSQGVRQAVIKVFLKIMMSHQN
ncbi:AAA family ATPase [Photobacterium leiognathi]|uniref:AAA family ATPase n=1 Tax=Photobacterium leiognathi TaxID=553611 RepID=UPI00273A102A|nr:AAA family ATPase [Photobacterium leiognathi]